MAGAFNFAEMIYSNVPENEYPEYDSTVSYNANDMVIFSKKTYRSLVGANKGNSISDTTKWVATGPTNRWALHDSTVATATSHYESIFNQYHLDGICTTVAFLNVQGRTLTVKMYDQVGGNGLVYNKTVVLAPDPATLTWPDYYYKQIGALTPDVVLDDLPVYKGAYIEVTISAPNDYASCGTLIFGAAIEVGKTQFSPRIGITDYSTKTVDAFGNYSITRRAYRKTADFAVQVDNTFIDKLQILLATYRSTAILYLGSDQFSSTFIYGYYKDFGITIEGPTHSICTISLEGLT